MLKRRNDLKSHLQKVKIIKFPMALMCALEKVGTICKLCMILMDVFGRISVERRNLMRNILAYRAPPIFVEKASIILVSIEIMCTNQFDIVKALKYVCEKREISSKPMSSIFYGLIFMWKNPFCKYTNRFKSCCASAVVYLVTSFVTQWEKYYT